MRLQTSMTLLVVLLALVTSVPAEAARPVHWFDCNLCHKAQVVTTSVWNYNICIECHSNPAPEITLRDGSTVVPPGIFAAHDASDAFGEATRALNETPSQQTSHYWASPKDVVPAAGAKAPTSAVYYSRYGISTGKVTCTRCHDPHLAKDDANPRAASNKLLRLTNLDALCLNCHRDWNQTTTQMGTHPIVKDYPAFAAANSDKYKSVTGYDATTLVLPTNVDNGTVRMVYNTVSATGVGSGTLNVSCSSCHGTHFTDSDSTTVDGPGQALSAGDGKMLLSDGAKRTDADPAVQGQLRSNLCQACHVYLKHGDANGNNHGQFAGCLDCHSGHAYDPTSPNIFVLRKNMTGVFTPKSGSVANVTGLQYTAGSQAWATAVGSGYCQGCHTLAFPHNGLNSATYGKTECGGCHFHANESSSFVANCTECHGYPPVLDEAGTIGAGYAVDEDHNRSYKYTDIAQSTLRAEFKNEAATPHKRHAGGGSDYAFGCDNCHAQAFIGTETHLNGDYQDVDFGALAGGTPAYNPGGSGTCSSVYCHSNGNAAAPAYAAVNWAGTAGSINGCAACHGNDAATMAGGAKNNSASHQKHLGAGAMGRSYGCNVCHVGTATGSTALVDAARLSGGVHVNGQAEVAFVESGSVLYNALGGGSFDAAANTCATVYCHSDGKGNFATPDWDVANSLGCNFCHKATPDSGSHTAHIRADGANIGCDRCHGADTETGAHAGHVNGVIDFVAESCATCHTVEAGDVALVWGDSATATCDACHGGTTATSYTDALTQPRSAATKAAYADFGHGKTGITQACTDCHDTAYDAAHMGADTTFRLKTIDGKAYTAEAPNAFCGACHDGGSGNETPHFAAADGHTSTDADLCNACHDPHGVANYDAMVKASIDGNDVAAFADKTLRASYANDNFDGICQVCHVVGEVSYFNRGSNDTNHAVGRLCIDCHDHTAEVAFKASCSGCHGGGFVGTTSGARNFWPDGLREHDANDAGAHQKHMLKVAERFNPAWTTVDALLNGATITQQLEMCEFCHAAVTNDTDHSTPGTAEVFVAQIGDPAVPTRFAKQLWAPYAADNDAAYAAGSCSAVDCHNGKTTPDANKWYPGHGTSTCVMCHDGEAGGPSSGSHAAHRGNNPTYYYNFTCGDCHGPAMTWSNTVAGTAPATAHIDGVKVVGITDDFTYDFNTLSCGTNSCHNDGKGGAPKVAHAWGTPINSCTNCHDWIVNTEGHTAHFDFDNNTVATRLMNCTPCHVPASPNHLNGAVNFIGAITYNSATYTAAELVAVGGDNHFGKCSTTACHNDGLGTPVTTPLWTETAVGVGKTTCTLCHVGVPNTGSHAKHVQLGQVPTVYNGAGLVSTTATDYSFRCDACHTTALSAHVNNLVNLTSSVTYNSASFSTAQLQAVGAGNNGKCSSASCHSTGATPTVYTATPIWGQPFPGDPCAGCHGNSPNNDVHHEHEVGFHYDAVYSGTTGFLPVTDADPIPAGLTGARAQLRGHGGRLLDGTPSATTLTCNVCHFDTVKVSHNSTGASCASCHTTPANPTVEQKAAGNAAMVIDDKTKHINGQRDVRFFDQKVRSKAQLRDDITDVPEIANNWTRIGGYKAATGLSYDEQPDVLYNMATWNSADKTCTVSCHLWEANRVDKIPVKWDGGTIMCIDCHTRLPK